MTTDRPRVGVIGVGAIGRHHARIYAADPGAELVGLYDTDDRRAQEIAELHGTRAYDAVGTLLDDVDAVTVAVPTLDHHAVGLLCLRHGCDVLMEKPIATTMKEAEELLEVAAANDRILLVGHVERYNPAVEALMPHVRKPAFIEIHRLGSFVDRSLEVDVVVDLMIHDLDIVHAFAGDEVVEVRAVGVPVLSSEVDIANARLQFAGGCTVNVTASRVSVNRVRKVRIFQPEAYFSVDYSSQEVAYFRLLREADKPSIEAVPLTIARGEPLVNELRDFLDCVATRSQPRVSGRDGCRALATALQIREAIQETATM